MQPTFLLPAKRDLTMESFFFIIYIFFYYIDDNMRQLCLSCRLKLPGCNQKKWFCRHVAGTGLVRQFFWGVFFWILKVLSESCTSSLLFQHRCALTSQEREHHHALYACPSLTGSKVFCFVFFPMRLRRGMTHK